MQSFLRVEVEFKEDQPPNPGCVAVLHFLVTNSAPVNKYYPQIIYEEVRLKVGISQKWHVVKVENLAGGQSFYYDHHCTREEITRLQWSIEGIISPEALLQFNRRPVNIEGAQQLSIESYFNYVANIDIFQRLKEIMENLSEPYSDMTICEIKAETGSLQSILDEIIETSQQIEEFLQFLNCQKYEKDVVKHKKIIQGCLKGSEHEIKDLMKIMNKCKVDAFNKTRKNMLAKLTKREDKLDKETRSLARKVGVLK